MQSQQLSGFCLVWHSLTNELSLIWMEVGCFNPVVFRLKWLLWKIQEFKISVFKLHVKFPFKFRFSLIPFLIQFCPPVSNLDNHTFHLNQFESIAPESKDILIIMIIRIQIQKYLKYSKKLFFCCVHFTAEYKVRTSKSGKKIC